MHFILFRPLNLEYQDSTYVEKSKDFSSLSLLTDNLNLGIFILDLNFEELYYNSQGLTLLGGQKLLDFIKLIKVVEVDEKDQNIVKA